MSENIYESSKRSQMSQAVQSPLASAYWSDQPRPSRGYVAFFVGSIVFVFVMLFSSLIQTFFVGGMHVAALIVELVIFTSIFVFCTVLFVLLLRTGNRIKYVLDEYTFQYSAGPGIAFSIPLDQISRVRKVAYVRRLMGWGTGGASLSNRFKNGVCLTITKGHKSRDFYITPTNPDEFIERLRVCREVYDAK